MADFTKDVGGTLELNRSTLLDGLVGWWSLTEANYQGGVFVDESGNGNDGTLANVPSFGIDAFHNPTGATQFVTASTDYISMGNVLDVGANDFSLSCWAKVPTLSASSLLICKGATISYRLYLNATWHQVVAYVRDGVGGWLSFVVHDTIIDDDKWHHICVTFDRSGNAIGYVDGVTGISTDISGESGSLNNNDNFYIGRSSGGDYLDGYFANARIYNRVLSLAEIKLLHTPSLMMALELNRSYGGGMTPAATLGVLVTPQPYPGALAPTGAVVPIPIYVQNVGGTLTLSGSLSAGNPAWLLIPDYLNWQGEWVATTAYDRDDLVLYQDGDLIHAFVSKTSHNVGNTPTTEYVHWTRLVQEKFNK